MLVGSGKTNWYPLGITVLMGRRTIIYTHILGTDVNEMYG